MCYKRASLHNGFQFLHDIRRRICKNLSDNIVATCGLPECPRDALIAEVSNHRPRIEYLRSAKTITVIPLADLIILFSSSVVRCHLPHFIRRKTEVFAVSMIQNRIDLQVVEAAEDALLCHTQNARQETIRQMRIVLQATRKQDSHEADHLIVIPKHMSLLNRRVVFINDDDWFHTVMFMQHSGQVQQ